MKSKKLLSIIVGASLIIAFTELPDESTRDESQWIVSVRNLTVQDRVEKAEAREYLESKYFALFEQLPGVNAMIGTPDRGVQKGDLVLIYIFDSKWTRDYHFPEEGQYSPKYRSLLKIPYTRFFWTSTLLKRDT